jgi:hypothetical protein
MLCDKYPGIFCFGKVVIQWLASPGPKISGIIFAVLDPTHCTIPYCMLTLHAK